MHRLLGAKFAEDGEARRVPQRTKGDRLDCGAVILDECSMVDITLIDALLRALPDDARLVMVGDADQLPSVGPGNVFSAVIRSGVVPTVKLTEIFRQNGGQQDRQKRAPYKQGGAPEPCGEYGRLFRLKRLQAAKLR